jgi:succinate dehydrogenase / fumarate reductase flavoprotein subunit
MELDPKVPSGPVQDKWDKRKFDLKLVNPANKRKYDVIVVGSGLAGASAAASLAELGYNVKCFAYQDSARRAHSIAAQGGINAAKNYQNDGDSVWRLFYDTVKGGDFRSREANVYRLAQVSNNIMDQCVAQGIPFAREYGGLLANRSFGGAQVSRTFYARGQTGQQLLLGAYQALMKEVATGKVTMIPRSEMLDVVIVDGHARGIVVRDLATGELTTHAAHAVVLATGGYANVFFLSTNAKGCNVTAAWRAHRRGALFANPCFTQIHPTCIPSAGDYQSKLTLMSESLRNDGRIWVPKNAGETRAAGDIPDADRDYYLERLYPSFGNLTPRDIASRRAKEAVDDGRGVGALKNGVYLDFRDAIQRLGKPVIAERYGNLFEMYERITGEDPYAVPMRIYPAPHYTMGGLWVDYDLMSTVPGLFVIWERVPSCRGWPMDTSCCRTRSVITSPAWGRSRSTPATPRLEKSGARWTNAPRNSSRRRARARSTVSTASWGPSCGRTAAWPATAPGWRVRSLGFPSSGSNTGGTSTCRAAGAT